MKNSKRVLSFALALVLVLALFPIVTPRANAATFTPRTTAPSTSDAKYYSSNPFYIAGYGMPNCTTYAWGRAWELLGNKPTLSKGNAKAWWGTSDGYSRGTEPKLGAIMCWNGINGDLGHVAVVEAINGNNVTISESNYIGRVFNTREISKSHSGTNQPFQGYIYIGDFSSVPVTISNVNSPKTQTVKNGVFTLKNAGTGKMLNVNSGTGDKDTTKVLAWDRDGSIEQQVRVEYSGNGKYYLYSMYSSGGNGRVINIDRDGAAQIGDILTIHSKVAGDNCQLFYLTPVGGGQYVFENASVTNYIIAPNGSGNGTQLTVQQYDSGNSAQRWIFCDLNGNAVDPVYAAPPATISSISVATKPSKTDYTVGDILSTAGLTLTSKYSDNSTKSITSGFTCSPTTLDKEGTQTITVTYNGKTTTFSVNVKAAEKPEEPKPEEPKSEETVTDGKATIPGVANGIKLSAIMTKVGVKFDWTPSTSTYGYRIYRSTVQGVEGISITDFPIVGGEYVDVNINEDTQYYYTIRVVEKEASFDQATTDVTPEVLSVSSEELAIVSKEIITVPNGPERHFILMQLDNPMMQVDQEKLEIDPGRGTTPIGLSGRTLVPIGAIIKSMGGTAEWVGAEKKILISANGHNIVMWVGRKDILADEASKEMDIAPQFVNERTLLPLKFVADNIDCQADYIGSTKQIIVVFYTNSEVTG